MLTEQIRDRWNQSESSLREAAMVAHRQLQMLRLSSSVTPQSKVIDI